MAKKLSDLLRMRGGPIDPEISETGVARPDRPSSFERDIDAEDMDLPTKKVTRISVVDGPNQGTIYEFIDVGGGQTEIVKYNSFGQKVDEVATFNERDKQGRPKKVQRKITGTFTNNQAKQFKQNILNRDKPKAPAGTATKLKVETVNKPRAEAQESLVGKRSKDARRRVVTPPAGMEELRETEFPISLEKEIGEDVFDETSGATQRRLDLIEAEERRGGKSALAKDPSRPTPAAIRDDRRRGTTGRGKRPVTSSERTIEGPRKTPFKVESVPTKTKVESGPYKGQKKRFYTGPGRTFPRPKGVPLLPGAPKEEPPRFGFGAEGRRDRFFNPRRPDVKGLPKPPRIGRSGGDIELARQRIDVERNRTAIAMRLADQLGIKDARERRKLDRALKQETIGNYGDKGGAGVRGFVNSFDLDEASLRNNSDPEIRKLVSRLDDLDAQLVNIERLENLSVGDRGTLPPAQGGGFTTDEGGFDRGPNAPERGDRSDRPRTRPLLTTADPGTDPTGRIRSLVEPGRYSGGRLTPDYPALMARRGRRRENALIALLELLDPNMAIERGLGPDVDVSRRGARPRILELASSGGEADPEFIGPRRAGTRVAGRVPLTGVVGGQILAPQQILELDPWLQGRGLPVLNNRDLAIRAALREMEPTPASRAPAGRRLAARAGALEEALGRAIRQQGMELSGDIGRRLQVLERVSPGLVANATSLGFSPKEILEKFSSLVERGDRTTNAIERMLSRGRAARSLTIPRGITGKIPPDLARAVMAILRRGR